MGEDMGEDVVVGEVSGSWEKTWVRSQALVR